jgi:hypothetical protein
VYALLADLTAIIHAGLIAFVVLGLLLVIVGAAAGWLWVRSFWFRTVHLAVIVFVCGESLFGLICPLTSLENRLRALGGRVGYPRDFIGYWIDRLIYYNFAPETFIVAYAIFGLIVAVVYGLAPPRWPARWLSLRRGVR